MKKILICTDHETLADAVSGWLENRDCKTYRVVGEAGKVKGRVNAAVRRFNPDILITSYRTPIDAHREIIAEEAKRTKQDISAYALCGHPDAYNQDYKVFPDIRAIFNEIGVAEAA